MLLGQQLCHMVISMFSFCVSEQELRRLKVDCRRSRSAAYAHGTVKNIKVHLRAYALFCLYFRFQLLPASVEAFALFAQLLSRSFKAVSSVKQYLHSVILIHRFYDLPAPSLSHFFLSSTLKGIARNSKHVPKQASPITPAILCQIRAVLNFKSPEHVSFWCMLLTGFFLMLRRVNLVPSSSHKQQCLLRGDVIVDQLVLVSLRWTKTIQSGGRILRLPLAPVPNSPLCPVTAFRHMLDVSPAPSSAPLFAFKSGSSWSFHTQSTFIFLFRQVLAKCHLDPMLFSGHSLRRGGASWAFHVGVPAELIKLVGDWRSSAYLAYLDISMPKKLAAVKSMVQAAHSSCDW